MDRDDSGPAAVIDRDLTALARRLPTVHADDETFRRCLAAGRRRRRRRVLAVTTTPLVLAVVAVVWAAAGHDTSGSTMVVTPAATSSAASTPRPDSRLAKISKLDARHLPPGAKLFLSGDLRGMVWRSYLLPDAPNDERLFLAASAGDSTDSASLAGPGVDQTRIAIGGEPAVLTREVGLARIDWVNVQQNVRYTVLDSGGILTNNTLIDVAEGLTAR